MAKTGLLAECHGVRIEGGGEVMQRFATECNAGESIGFNCGGVGWDLGRQRRTVPNTSEQNRTVFRRCQILSGFRSGECGNCRDVAEVDIYLMIADAGGGGHAAREQVSSRAGESGGEVGMENGEWKMESEGGAAREVGSNRE